MVSTGTKFARNKRTLDRKSISTHRNEVFDKKLVSTIRKNLPSQLRTEKIEKIGLNQISRMVSTSRQLAVSGLSEIERIKCFPLTRKSVSTNRNNSIFLKLDFPVLTRQKVGFHQWEWRICLRIRFYQRKKLPLLTGISEKSKTMVVNGSNKSFKQAFL